jgi:hypothetical protein
MAAGAEVTSRENLTPCREARNPDTYCRPLSSQIVWRVSFVATRVYALPGVVVLAVLGANVYGISLVMKMRHLLGSSEAATAAA